MAAILGSPIRGALFREICDAVSALTKRPVFFRAHRHRPPPGAIVYHWENGPLLSNVGQAPMIWDFSSGNVAKYPASLKPRVRYVPCGHHKTMEGRFKVASPRHARYDIAWVGSMNPRRRHILNALRARRFSVIEVPPTMFGRQRDALLSRARLLLNVRYHTNGVFPVLRSAHAAANMLPCLGENSREMPPWVVEHVSYGNIVERAAWLLRDHTRLTRLAAKTLEAFRKFPLVLP